LRLCAFAVKRTTKYNNLLRREQPKRPEKDPSERMFIRAGNKLQQIRNQIIDFQHLVKKLRNTKKDNKRQQLISLAKEKPLQGLG